MHGAYSTKIGFCVLLCYHSVLLLLSFFLSFFLLFHSLFSSSFCSLSLVLYSVTLNEMIPSPDLQYLFKLKCEHLNVRFRAFCSYRLLTSYPTNELNSISSVIHKKLTYVPNGLQVSSLSSNSTVPKAVSVILC